MIGDNRKDDVITFKIDQTEESLLLNRFSRSTRFAPQKMAMIFFKLGILVAHM